VVKKRREIKEIIARYISELDKLGIEVSQVILYGSYAKGTQMEYSDIDVAVISPAFAKLDIFERQEILSRAHHKFHVPLEPIGLTPKQLEEKQGLVRVIVESGITIFAKGGTAPDYFLPSPRSAYGLRKSTRR
jgi:predicted nucleotidyltransferase